MGLVVLVVKGMIFFLLLQIEPILIDRWIMIA